MSRYAARSFGLVLVIIFKDGKTSLSVHVSGKDFQVSSLGEGREVECAFNLEDGSLAVNVKWTLEDK